MAKQRTIWKWVIEHVRPWGTTHQPPPNQTEHCDSWKDIMENIKKATDKFIIGIKIIFRF